MNPEIAVGWYAVNGVQASSLLIVLDAVDADGTSDELMATTTASRAWFEVKAEPGKAL